MKKNLRLLSLFFLLTMIWGCQKSDKPSLDGPGQESERTVLDSLRKLESLVNPEFDT